LRTHALQTGWRDGWLRVLFVMLWLLAWFSLSPSGAKDRHLILFSFLLPYFLR